MYQALFFFPLEPKKQEKKKTPDLRLGRHATLLPTSVEERCVTTLITARKETIL